MFDGRALVRQFFLVGFLKSKLAKFGCFFGIAILMIGATALTKLVLGWFDFDDRTKEEVGRLAGEYLGKGCLAFVLCVGFVSVIRQLKAEISGKRSMPPPLQVEATDRSAPAGIFVAGASPSPVPVSDGRNPSRSGVVVKGCLLAVAAAVLLVSLALGVIWYLASEYEKRPKVPGELELVRAEKLIEVFKDRESFGNNAEAEKLAESFARQLRLSKLVLVGESKDSFGDLTKGRFLTYCMRSGDSTAFIVHVPGLRGFTQEAELFLEEQAWIVASNLVAKEIPGSNRLAVGIKGAMDYSAIITGTTNRKEPLNGIETRHPVVSKRPLWPYFIGAKAASDMKQDQPR